MPADPCGSMMPSPALTEGQTDSLLQRQDFYEDSLLHLCDQYLPAEQAWELHLRYLAMVRFIQFPEYFGGDETKLMQRAYTHRVQDNDGQRPMPNGYKPRNPEADANSVCDTLGTPRRRKKGLL